MGLKRNSCGDGSPPKAMPENSGGAWDKSYPNVVEFLSKVTWEDGSGRSTGTVMFLVENGWWKAWVHDRDASLGCFVSASSLPDLLKTLNQGLETGAMDWRPDRNGKKK